MKKTLYFGAEWCGPCKLMKPIVENLKKEGHDIRYYDSDKETVLVRYYSVTSLPTFVLVEDDLEIGRWTGATTENALRSFVKGE